MKRADDNKQGPKARTSKMAVASVVIPLVLFIACLYTIFSGQGKQPQSIAPSTFVSFSIVLAGFCLAPVGFLLGLLSLMKIKTSGGLMKGYIFGCAGLLLSVVCWHYLKVASVTGCKERTIYVCQSGMRHLAGMLRTYSNDCDGKYPTPDKWCDLLVKYIEPGPFDEYREYRFLCVTGVEERERDRGYAINPNATPNSGSDVVVLFETKSDSERCWNRFGGAEIMTFENHSRVTLRALLTSLPFKQDCFVGGCNVLFNDGSAELIYPDGVGDLNWGDEQDNN